MTSTSRRHRDPAAAEAVDAGIDLAARVADAARSTRAVLGQDPGDPRSPSADGVLPVLAGLGRELSRAFADDALDGAGVRLRCELLAEVAELESAVRAHALRSVPARRERLEAALDRLRDAESPREVIEAAPEELCGLGGFDRAMISRVRGSTWVPHRLHVAEDPAHPANVALRDFARDAEVPLVSSMLEAELVRRRAPALVHDAQLEARTFRPVVELSRSRSYVVAPVVVCGTVIGFFHADTFSTGRSLTSHDREGAQDFADGLGLVFERAVHAERLLAGRRSVTAALAEGRERVREISGAAVGLGMPERVPVAAGEPDARLTRREREVLALLARGATNDQIAEELVIAQSTVKSHVKHVMRKTRAANRAEAVSRYLRLASSGAHAA